MPSEAWKSIAGFEGLYEVSDHGRVRRLPVRIIHASRWGHEIASNRPGLILKPMPGQYGYPRVHLNRQGNKPSARSVHLLVLEAFVGPCPPGMEARHLDGKRDNPRLNNLCWGTKLENMADRDRHGKTVRGENMNTAKLTEPDVLKLREDRALGKLKVSAAAAHYGVLPGTIYDVLKRKTWSHI